MINPFAELALKILYLLEILFGLCALFVKYGISISGIFIFPLSIISFSINWTHGLIDRVKEILRTKLKPDCYNKLYNKPKKDKTPLTKIISNIIWIIFSICCFILWYLFVSRLVILINILIPNFYDFKSPGILPMIPDKEFIGNLLLTISGIIAGAISLIIFNYINQKNLGEERKGNDNEDFYYSISYWFILTMIIDVFLSKLFNP